MTHGGSGQCRRGGHPEEQCVGYGRRKCREQPRAPAVLVGAHEREEVDRQPCRPAQTDRVEELRQDDVAREEEGGRQIGFRFAVFQRIEFYGSRLHITFL